MFKNAFLYVTRKKNKNFNIIVSNDYNGKFKPYKYSYKKRNRRSI